MTGHAPAGSLEHRRSTILAMHLGWISTVVALASVWIDHATANVLAQHIRAGYPHYSSAHVHSAATTYLIYLSVVGGAGLIAWLSTIRAVKHNRRWIPSAATVTFILAASLSVTDLLIRDTSGDTGLPPDLGWVGLLPCLPGLVAVILLWKDRRATARLRP
jgi:hypothetical protein